MLAQCGRIDILVNNAGITQPRKTADITAADYDAVLDVSLRGTLHMSQAVLPAMQKARSGAIVCISSVSAQRGGGILGGPHYSAAKAGVLGLARAMAREFGVDGIRVNCVTPGLIATDINKGKLIPDDKMKGILEQIPLNRLGEPADVAGGVRVPGQRPGQVLHRHHARRERRHADPLTIRRALSTIPTQRRASTRQHRRQPCNADPSPWPHSRWPPSPPRRRRRPTKLTLGHGAAPGNPRHEAAVKFAETVKAKTNGRYEIQVAHSAQLGDDAAMVTALRSGTLDMSANSQGAIANVVPEYAALGLPFLFNDIQKRLEAARRPGGRGAGQAHRRQGHGRAGLLGQRHPPRHQQQARRSRRRPT